MAQRNRMVLLHQQRPNNLGPYRRMLLRSCKKELPRQTHQNRLLRQRPRLGRKLLHPPKITLPRSPHRELLHGQSTRPRVPPEQSRQTSHHRHPRRSHHRIPLFPLSVIPTITVIPGPTGDLPTTNPMLPQDNMGSLVYRAGEASPSSCPISYTDYSAVCSVGFPSAS